MKQLLTIYLLLLTGFVQGQDLFQGSLFPAELIMKNRDKISLTDQQADKIKAIHGKNAGEFSTLRWDLDAENEKLKKMLQEPKINTEAAQKQMDKVLNLENQLKKKQFTNLLAIRNELNEKQTTELSQLGKNTTFNWTTSERVQGTSSPNVVSVFSTKGSTSATTLDGEKKASVVLRGTSNLSGENKPLFIVKKDGKETEVKDMNDMNPTDIESITVLKDATATFQYGARGSNGVVIITLKKDSDFKFE
ncbi:TonB-dependent receptor plug domain-containing protein [Belliella sp. R4-6]|uniref:TonB-dependent receptor plug domain-containing protein n=1 Tax=Belliella alkalica TaxID=1730871 RepID=A0ABS9VAS6_9BACT|nr:TonB-dependent receptor plug domain-containing protein [Belliella alkalica]MCH7413511.1 TonB-dependent receptor plug domain-containing protein [Belliella alkalica]